MAGPQSFVPPSVTPSKTKQRFTLDQANKSLPLVSRIVKDIVQTHQKVAALQTKAQGANVRENDRTALEKDLAISVDRLQAFIDELSAIGVELKDFQIGLVDFIGRHQGRDVYLCWKLGEQSISFWHDLQTGFSGRQPVATLEEDE